MDNSFIKFSDNFNDAKDLHDSNVSTLDYYNQVQLKPGESYSGISNIKNSIAFDGNYRAYFVDVENNILDEITDTFFIEEFSHNEYVSEQIKFEIINIANDYYSDFVHIRIDHTILNGKSYWSNPINVSDYEAEQTTRFDYKHNQNLDGTCYEVANILQSIRLRCFKNKRPIGSTSQSYTTLDGIKLSSRVIKTKFYAFIFDMCNDFTYERLQHMLCCDVLYVDGIRVTDKQTFEQSDKFSENTNISQEKFKLAVDENDVYVHEYQIYGSLALLTKVPEGLYTFATYATATDGGTKFTLLFNKPFSINAGITAKLYRGTTLVTTFDNSKFSIVGNSLEIDVSSSPITTDGVYSVVIDDNMVYTDFEVWHGLIFGQWQFSISTGFYNSTYYNSDNYNTN